MSGVGNGSGAAGEGSSPAVGRGSGSPSADIAFGSRRRVVLKSKNALGNRSDPGWNYDLSIDGDTKKIQRKYCEKVMTGGVHRLKHHFAGSYKDIAPCISVPKDVQQEMEKIVKKGLSNLVQKSV